MSETQPVGRSPLQAQTAHLSDSLDIHRMVSLIRSRLWLVLLVTVFCFLAAVFYLLKTPKTYASTAVIQVEQNPQSVVSTIQDVSVEDPQKADYLQTVVNALTSNKMLLRVIKATDLTKDPNFAPPLPAGKSYMDIDLAGRLNKNVEVQLERGTRLISITVNDQNPQTAQTLAQAFVKEFFREDFDQKFAVSAVANEYLQDEAEKLRQKLEVSERKLQAYKEEHNAVSLEQSQNIIVEKLNELNTKATDAKAARIHLESDMEQLKNIPPQDIDRLMTINSVVQIPQVATIRAQLVNAEAELAGIKQRYLPKHPKYIAAITTIENLKTSLRDSLSKAGDTIQTQYEAAANAEQKIGLALQAQEQEALLLNRVAIPYNVLQRDVESDRALYEAITKRVKETAITQGIDQPPFRVIEEPLASSVPSKPRVKLILALALLLGGILGIGAVLVLDAIDYTLRTVDEAEFYLGLPVLAAIPDSKDVRFSTQFGEFWQTVKKEHRVDGKKARDLLALTITLSAARIRAFFPIFFGAGNDASAESDKRHPIVLIEDPASHQSEAIRTLRTSLSLLGKQAEHRSFLFTSAIASEGKSFCSLNMACSFAQQGLKTVIIDADLRRPQLKKDLLPKAGDIPGLTDVLSEQAALQEALCETSIPNLILLPAGRKAPNPAELLHSGDFPGVIKNLLLKFDRIVVDSPPVNAVSDVLVIASEIQFTCLVVRAGKAPKKAVHRAIQQLRKAGAHFAGFILNRLPVSGRSAEYYYYHYGDEYAKDSVYGSRGK